MSKFLSYILNLRGAAILFVVGVHSRGNVFDWESHPTSFNFLSEIFDSHEGNGTVMFIFIGGFLFHYLTHQSFEFRKYIDKKFQYVILPYILISIPIIAYRILTNFDYDALPAGFNDWFFGYQFLYYLVTGLHMAPFWFISAIVLFYLSSPLFHALDNEKFYRYFFPFVFITCLFTFRSVHNANPILSYLHYCPIYLLGMWTAYYKDRIFAHENIALTGLVITFIGVSIAEAMGWVTMPTKITFEDVIREGLLVFNVYMLKAVILCFTVMLILYKFREKRMAFLEIIGEYSFGIFFIHCILIYVSRKIMITLFGPFDFSLLTFLIFFAFILLASTAIVFFIKKLTGRYSRNLIGS
jgi:peptidoglycan/LPS O-acetylase OafA/YrhL